MRKILLALFSLVFVGSAYGQALPVFNNVSAPLLSTPGAYALAGGGATAANMGSFAPAAGAGAAVLVGTGALAVGMAVGYNLMGLVLGDGENNAAVPLTEGGEVPEPAAPATAGTVTMYDGQSSVDAACSAYAAAGSGVASCYGLPAHTTMTVTGITGSTCSIHKVYTIDSSGGNCGTYDQTYSPYQTTACGSGYVMSSGVCTLQDARQAQPDNRNDVGRSGGAFNMPPDADSSNSAIPKGTITAGPGGAGSSWQVVGQSSSGNPIVIKVDAQAPGGSRLEISEQVQDANSNSFVRTRVLEIAPNSVVTSDSQTMAPSSLSYDPVTQTATQNNSTNTTPYSNPEMQQQPITFPTDYARQGEAAAAATSITNALLAPSAAPADPVLPDAAQFDDAFFKNTFDGLKGWSVPNHVSTCPQPGFDWNGSSYTINSHCQLWTDHQSAIAAAMLVVWSIAALFIVLRA